MNDKEKLSGSKLKALYTTLLSNPLKHISSSFRKSQNQAASKRKQEHGLDLQDPKPCKRQKPKVKKGVASEAIEKQTAEQESPKQRRQAQTTSMSPRKDPITPKQQLISGAGNQGGVASLKKPAVQYRGRFGKAGVKPVSQLVRVKRTYGRSLISRCSTTPRPSLAMPSYRRGAQRNDKRESSQDAAFMKKPATLGSKQLPASSVRLLALCELPDRGELRTLGEILPKAAPTSGRTGSIPKEAQPSTSQPKAEPLHKLSAKCSSEQILKAAGQAVVSEQAVRECLQMTSIPPVGGLPDSDDLAQEPASQWQTFLPQTARPSDRDTAKTNPSAAKNPLAPETPPVSQGRAAENKDFGGHSNLTDCRNLNPGKADSGGQASQESRDGVALEGECQIQKQTRKRPAFLAAQESIASLLGQGGDEVSRRDGAALQKNARTLHRFLNAEDIDIDCSKAGNPASSNKEQPAPLRQSIQRATKVGQIKHKPVSDKLLAALGLPIPRLAKLQGKRKARSSCSPRSETLQPAESTRLKYPPLPYSQWELEAWREPQRTPRIADQRHTHLPKRSRRASGNPWNDTSADEQKGKSASTDPRLLPNLTEMRRQELLSAMEISSPMYPYCMLPAL